MNGRSVVCALVVLAACAKSSSPSYQTAMPSSGYADYEGQEVMASRGGRAEKAEDYAPSPPPPPPPPMAPRPPGAPRMDLDGAADLQPEPEPAPAPSPSPTAPAPARMVHYDGYAQLRVADPTELLDEVVALAEAVGGRTENLYGMQVTVRVPVAVFEDTYRQVLALGDVMHKTVRADDVTAQFLAVDLRVANLRTTRARLVALLAKATDENEKLRLLAEITRVSEELDAFESQLRTLSDLASMSRISVDAVPRQAFANADRRPELHGFEWIRGMSPFNHGVWDDDKRVELVVPKGLVALSKTGPYSAESADGVTLWTQRVPNDPVGDAGFWIDAAGDRISAEFANPKEQLVGAWSCLELDQPGADLPYHWSVCVRSAGNKLDVAQVFYPTPDLYERYQKDVEASLSGGGAT